MNELDWLVNRRLLEFTGGGQRWILKFEGDAYLDIQCLWRFLVAGSIELTSKDDGQKFGLPKPIIASEELSRKIVGSTITSVKLREATLDLVLIFDSNHSLEIFPTSSGYEAWIAGNQDHQFIAMGGGELAIF